jgi:hypothetical protein
MCIKGELTSRIGRHVRFGAPQDVQQKGGRAAHGVIVDEVWADPNVYSRIQDEPAAVAAVLDVRSNPAPYGDLERDLKRDLWEKLGVRLCVRRAR